jgi:Ca2+-binding EF-hand superfamily protein
VLTGCFSRWAIGVITYLLLSGETPFGGLDGENLLVVKENIMRAQVKFVPTETWDQVSEDGKAFVKRLLHPDPKKRPGAKEMQRCKWIQVWAKKDAAVGHRLSGRTVSALMKFKESSDMQKLLSEVLSFTLLPEQIVELRKEFEKIDDDGDGQITLSSLKRVLVQNAEVGALGGLSEKEVEEIFDSIKVRKGGEPTLYWHEFLAAGLSQARVDERNLKLAFDRLDSHRHGYLTYEDLSQIGKIFFESNHLERIWSEGLMECKCQLDRIYFEDFKKLMKGQPKNIAVAPKLASIPSGAELRDNAIIEDVVRRSAVCAMEDRSQTSPSRRYGKPRSASYELKSTSTWEDETTETQNASSVRDIPTRSMLRPVNSELDPDLSPLASNRALYRKHREMRLAVLDASKQFDSKRKNRSNPGQAGLTMRRGSVLLPVELDDTHTRALFASAAHRSGRRTKREKTVSDVTGLISFPNQEDGSAE